ncbi:MAG: hypothetical protein EBT86_07105 [Actinobacteria bacterium]|nr:hypothetical protein [Actinomycetota bacterium]
MSDGGSLLNNRSGIDTVSANTPEMNTSRENSNDITSILEEGAREAYSRPWFRLERGLRLNRLRLYVNENFSPKGLKQEELEHVVSYLTRALDKKLLNTAKIVDYDTGRQRISSIKGFEVRRQADGGIRCGFLKKKPETAKANLGKPVSSSGTRRAKQGDSSLSGTHEN